MKSIKCLFLTLVVALTSMASTSYVASSAPTPKSPIIGSVVTTYKPTLTWLASVPATGTTIANYQIVYDFASNFLYSPTTVNVGNVASYKMIALLSAGRVYYWHIRAKNNLGQWSAWSSTAYFYTAINSPVATSPLDGDDSSTNPTLQSLRPTFTWTAGSANAQSFTIQVSSDCGFSATIISADIPSSIHQYTPASDLPAAQHLCWRVRSNNSPFGPSAWSAVSMFLSPNPPSVPVLVAPADNTLTNDNTPRLDWNNVALATGYTVEISDAEDFTTSPTTNLLPCPSPMPKINFHCTFDVATSEYQVHEQPDPNPDALPGAATTYWRARSYNSAGEYSAWSSSRILRITPDRPANLTTLPVVPTDPRPLFNWDNVAGPGMSYRIFVSTTPSFASTIIDAITKVSQYRPAVDLPGGITLYWRVYAISAEYGTSLASILDSNSTFMSANPPSTPNLVAPAFNTTVTDTTPQFLWSASSVPAGTTFSYYQIEIAENANFTINLISKNRPVRSYTPVAPLSHLKKYYWMVRACNMVGQCSTWSAKYYFTVQ